MKWFALTVSVFALLANSGQVRAEEYQVVDLGVPAAGVSSNININDLGIVAGESIYDLDTTRASLFVWKQGQATILHNIVDQGSGFHLSKMHWGAVCSGVISCGY